MLVLEAIVVCTEVRYNLIRNEQSSITNVIRNVETLMALRRDRDIVKLNQ